MKQYCLNPLVYLIALLSIPSFSQNSINGSITDSDKNPVAFANVILLQAKDSATVYKGTVSEEDGKFIIEDVADDEYLLQISFVGYEDYLKKIKVKNGENLGRIILKESENGLDEVVVNARKPKVSRKVDRLVFDVENTSISSGDSWDILKYTPGVMVSQGQLLIKNKPAVVYINDRKVYLSQQELQQLLQGFSGNNIKSVEVITNPPARYDADGGAILNIVTSKNISIGYKGDISASNTIAIVPKYTVGTSQYYKNDWLNAYASYNYNSRYDYKEDIGNITYYEPNGNVDSYWDNIFKKDSRTISHSLNTNLDFTLNENNSLSLSANLLFTPKSDSEIIGKTEIFNPQRQLDSLYTTDSDVNSNQDNLLFNATYSSNLNDKGANLSVQANYINYKNDQFQDLTTTFLNSEEVAYDRNNFSTVSFQDTEILAAQVDLTTSIAGLPFETGLKASRILSDSGLDFFNVDNTIDYSVGFLSDAFKYDENIYAGYVSLSKDWDKWAVKAGLRGEYTDALGTSSNVGALNDQQYFELFPTFFLLHSPSEDHSYSLNYSRRISRPAFQSLNSFRYFLNENNFQEGNPQLQPGITNKITLNYTYKSKLSFDLYWEGTNNAITILPFQNNEFKFLRSVNSNLDYDQQYSLDVSYYSYVNDWWYFSGLASFYNLKSDFYALESGNQKVTNEVTSAFVNIFNQFTLSKDRTFTMDVSGMYLPDFIAGSYDFDPQYSLNIGLRKSFLNGRLIATVNADDIFNTNNIPLVSKYLNQNNSFFAKPESRKVRFSLRYKFGNFKLRDNQRAVDAEEGERLKEKSLL